jgi:hypothetical protein
MMATAAATRTSRPPNHDRLQLIKQAAADRWPEILARLGGIEPEILDGKHHPCPKCGGTDRFRMIDEGAGALYCNQCFSKGNGDGIAAIQWVNGWDFRETLDALAEYLGLGSYSDNSHAGSGDIIEQIARLKGITADALRSYGAAIGTRGKMTVCRVPMYDADMNRVGDFDMSPATPELEKGKTVKGSKLGLFVSRKPASGDSIILVEGVKDACALHSLGMHAVGLPTCRMNAAFARMFRGCHVVVVPDRDKAGLDGAEVTAGNLYGVAASVHIAELPAEYRESGGDDVRDVLRTKDGERKVRDAIVNARPWKPTSTASPRAVDVSGSFKPFPVDCLPHPLDKFIPAGAEAIGCDASMIALPLLSAIAGTIGNTRVARIKHDWKAPANIWTAIIAESGTMKSPAQRLALRPLHEMQERAMGQYAREREEFDAAMERYKLDVKRWEKAGANQGDPRPEKPKEPVFRHYTMDNTTVEALANALARNPRGVVLATDELATLFSGMNQYKSGKGSDVAQWLQMQNAGPIKIDRKSGDQTTLYIRRANVSVTGGIQPETLRRAFGFEHIANGMAARFLFTQPPRRPRRWTEAEVPLDLTRQVEIVFERLAALQFTVDADGNPEPVDVHLTPEAKDVFVEFVNRHGEEQATMTGGIASAWSKLEEYAVRLALVLHMVAYVAEVPGVSGEAIDQASMESGIALTEWFKRESVRVYTTLQESEEQRDERELVEIIREMGGVVSPRDLVRRTRRFHGSSDDAEAALVELAKKGKGEWSTQPPGDKGGRPTRRFVLKGCDIAGGVDETPENTEVLGGFGYVDTQEVQETDQE